jgi:hypothetical protein
MSDQISLRPFTSSWGLQNLPASLSYLIAIRAHELYELRYKQDGHALEDWLQAESEIANPVPRVGWLVGVR